jgi:hypothetical protein
LVDVVLYVGLEGDAPLIVFGKVDGRLDLVGVRAVAVDQFVRGAVDDILVVPVGSVLEISTLIGDSEEGFDTSGSSGENADGSRGCNSPLSNRARNTKAISKRGRNSVLISR